MTQFLSCILTVYIFVLCHASVMLRLFLEGTIGHQKNQATNALTRSFMMVRMAKFLQKMKGRKRMVENETNCRFDSMIECLLFLCTRALPMGDIRWWYCLKAI